MRVAQQFRRDAFHQPVFHRARGLARGQARAVAQAEDMRVHRHGRLAEHHVQHDIRCLAAHAGQGFQRGAVPRDFAAMAFHQHGRERRDILRLGLPKADAADELADALGAQRRHGGGIWGGGEEAWRHLVHHRIRGLRGHHHGDQQGEGVGVEQLRLRRGILGRDGADELARLLARHEARAARRGCGAMQGFCGGFHAGIHPI